MDAQSGNPTVFMLQQRSLPPNALQQTQLSSVVDITPPAVPAQIRPFVFTLPIASLKTPAEIALEQEHEKHKERAERFGIEFKEPLKEVFAREVKRHENPYGKMALGFDLHSPEQHERLQKRKLRFGETTSQTEPLEQLAAGAMSLDAREPRQEPTPTSVVRKTALYVYGTDQMSTNDIFQFLVEYGPSFIEWLHDSACVVVFEDEFAAKRALLSVGVPQQDSAPGVVTPFLWYRSKQEYKGQYLQLRIATHDDVKPVIPKQSMYYATMFARKKSGKHHGGKAKRRKGAQPLFNEAKSELESVRKQKRRKRTKRALMGASSDDADVIMMDADAATH